MEDLQRLMIERACERLVLRYARSVDLDGRAGLEAVFSEDAVLDIGGQVYRGRAAITGTRPGPAPLMRHVCTNIVIDVLDETHATGTTYLTAYVQAEGDTELALPAVLGEYRDEFRLTDEGWRIAVRTFTPTLRRTPPTS